MPITDALVLTAIVAAFVAFGVVLAWGQYQTRHIRPTIRASVAKIDDNRPPIRLAAVNKVREAA